MSDFLVPPLISAHDSDADRKSTRLNSSPCNLVCRLLLEKKKIIPIYGKYSTHKPHTLPTHIISIATRRLWITSLNASRAVSSTCIRPAATLPYRISYQN